MSLGVNNYRIVCIK